MAGIRVGTLYSQNRDLVEALDQLGCFHGVPGPVQNQVARLLQDKGKCVLHSFIYHSRSFFPTFTFCVETPFSVNLNVVEIFSFRSAAEGRTPDQGQNLIIFESMAFQCLRLDLKPWPCILVRSPFVDPGQKTVKKHLQQN